MRWDFNANDTLSKVIGNEIEVSISDMIEGEGKPDPIIFFKAWQVPIPIIAERIRRIGIGATSNEIRAIFKNGIRTKEERYILSLVMMEMRNDITKTLY